MITPDSSASRATVTVVSATLAMRTGEDEFEEPRRRAFTD